MTSPLAWFGLAEDADEREIKRAYAKRLKSVRPDIDPAGFQLLHDMYQRALAWRARTPLPAEPATEDEESHQPSPELALAGSAEDRERTVASQVPAPSGRAEVQSPAPTPREPASAWHPVRFGPPVPTPPARPPFDTDVFTADFLDIAVASKADSVRNWLEQQQELWSLHIKHEAGLAVIRRLFRDPPPISMSSFDTTLEFFGFDHALTGIDPLQLQQLRQTMQERYALVQRFATSVQPWGENRQRLDLDAFFQWFCELADEGDNERIAALMHMQPALRTLSVRQQVAPRLLERLLRERPPMPQDCAGLLLNFFALGPLATQGGHNPGELIAHLHMKWLTQPRNTKRLVLQVKEPSQAYGDPRRARRQLRWLQRPFQWGWLALAALVPKLLYSLGLFAWRISGGVPARLDDFFDARLTRFCILIADRTRVSTPRFFVGAVRCAVLLLIGAALTIWMIVSGITENSSDAWLPLFLAGTTSAAWLCYLGFTLLLLWQQRPEEPVQPRPLLRMSLVPLLVTAGLVLYLVADQIVVAQALLLPTALLSFLRYQRRNPTQRQSSALTSVVVIIYAIGMVAWLMLRYPAVPIVVAMTCWLADLAKQGKRLRFRYRQPSAPPPLQASTGAS